MYMYMQTTERSQCEKMRIILCWIFLVSFGLLHKGDCFRPPDFRSGWLLLSAQGGPSSVLDVEHGLGIVPDLVEVMVKATDGVNKDFIFKAMGHAGKDDDNNHVYGGVVYFYNAQFVRVVAPNKNNHHATGGAIYTGESPYWSGVNDQFSRDAYIQVRCWTVQSLPTPCFYNVGSEIKSGSTAGSKSYIEFQHGLTRYPDVMKVRAEMTDSAMVGWYCDAHGSVTGQFSQLGGYNGQGGMHFGYSDTTVRIWASSHRNDVLCGAEDGWGTVGMVSRTGLLEVMAWCDLGLHVVYENSISMDASTDINDLEIHLPLSIAEIDNVLLSFMVRVESGPNAGFLFEGLGSAKSSVYAINTEPCDYGGIIYAYSDSIIRMWKPNADHNGAAVCISEGYGEGQNVQGATDVTVVINVRQWLVLPTVQAYEPTASFYCGHFYRVGDGLSVSYDFLNQQYSVSVSQCWQLCHSDSECSTFTYKNNLCKTYKQLDNNLISIEAGSELWTK